MLVGDRAMRSLNRRFRGRDVPTDVLAFSQLEEPAGAGAACRPAGRRAAPAGAPPRLLGDVVISLDTARRQARELGVAPAARLRTLLIHGFLHLLGYDHERSAAAARAMLGRERRLAAALGARPGAARRRAAPGNSGGRP